MILIDKPFFHLVNNSNNLNSLHPHFTLFYIFEICINNKIIQFNIKRHVLKYWIYIHVNNLQKCIKQYYLLNISLKRYSLIKLL